MIKSPLRCEDERIRRFKNALLFTLEENQLSSSERARRRGEGLKCVSHSIAGWGFDESEKEKRLGSSALLES